MVKSINKRQELVIILPSGDVYAEYIEGHNCVEILDCCSRDTPVITYRVTTKDSHKFYSQGFLFIHTIPVTTPEDESGEGEV